MRKSQITWLDHSSKGIVAVLKGRREKDGLTPQTLAERMQEPKRVVNATEGNTREPTLRAFIKYMYAVDPMEADKLVLEIAELAAIEREKSENWRRQELDRLEERIEHLTKGAPPRLPPRKAGAGPIKWSPPRPARKTTSRSPRKAVARAPRKRTQPRIPGD